MKTVYTRSLASPEFNINDKAAKLCQQQSNCYLHETLYACMKYILVDSAQQSQLVFIRIE
jgi:hypothetical protein